MAISSADYASYCISITAAIRPTYFESIFAPFIKTQQSAFDAAYKISTFVSFYWTNSAAKIYPDDISDQPTD